MSAGTGGRQEKEICLMGGRRWKFVSRRSPVARDRDLLFQLRVLSFPDVPEKHQDSEGHERTGKPWEELSA